MVRMRPIRAAIRAASRAEMPARTFAPKKIAPRGAGSTPNRGVPDADDPVGVQAGLPEACSVAITIPATRAPVAVENDPRGSTSRRRLSAGRAAGSR